VITELELEIERANLARSEEGIAAGEQRITEQIVRIERLRAGGHDMTDAERVLKALQNTLREWQTRRDGILKRIAHLERKPDCTTFES
jgi:hypothetical protein